MLKEGNADAAFGPQTQSGKRRDVDRTLNAQRVVDAWVGRVLSLQFDVVELAWSDLGYCIEPYIGEDEDPRPPECRRGANLQLEEVLDPLLLIKKDELLGGAISPIIVASPLLLTSTSTVPVNHSVRLKFSVPQPAKARLPGLLERPSALRSGRPPSVGFFSVTSRAVASSVARVTLPERRPPV